MVDSKFGPVPFGSVLSYQCPPELSRDVIKHPGGPQGYLKRMRSEPGSEEGTGAPWKETCAVDTKVEGNMRSRHQS